MTNPDFVRLAQAMGVHAIKCETAEDLPHKMKEFLEYPEDKPVLMECLVSRTEHVFPMVWARYIDFLLFANLITRYPRARPSTNRCFTQNFGDPKPAKRLEHEELRLHY